MAAPTPSIDKETLVELYIVRRLSQPAIARLLGKGQRTIRRLMKRYGIKARDCRGKNNSRYSTGITVGHSEYKRRRKSYCERCNSAFKLCVHHKNDDHYDNRIENLETLCHSCHMSITKKKWWDAKKAGLPTPKSNGRVGWYRKLCSAPGQLGSMPPGSLDAALGDADRAD